MPSICMADLCDMVVEAKREALAKSKGSKK
jgi:hypothetical protein